MIERFPLCLQLGLHKLLPVTAEPQSNKSQQLICLTSAVLRVLVTEFLDLI